MQWVLKGETTNSEGQRGIEPRSAWDVRYPIGLLLALLAAVPLAGAGWFAIDHTRNATVQRDQTATVDESVHELIVVNELRTRLLDERNWYLAIQGIEDIGLDPSIAAALTGIDALAELERSQAEVDALLVALDDPEVTAEVQNIRVAEEMDLSTVGLRYGAVESELSATGDATLDDLLGRAGTLEDADRLVTALRILRASTVARQAISNEFTAFFNAQFLSVQGVSADLRDAVETGLSGPKPNATYAGWRSTVRRPTRRSASSRPRPTPTSSTRP